jgi:hypothetical protein
VAAGRGELRPAVDFGEQVQVGFRGMLQIGIHHSQDLTASDLPAANHGRGETTLSLPSHHTHARVSRDELERDRPGAVRTIVVHHDQLVRFAERWPEHRFQLVDQRDDVLRFVEGRDDQRKPDRRIVQGRVAIDAKLTGGRRDAAIRGQAGGQAR